MPLKSSRSSAPRMGWTARWWGLWVCDWSYARMPYTTTPVQIVDITFQAGVQRSQSPQMKAYNTQRLPRCISTGAWLGALAQLVETRGTPGNPLVVGFRIQHPTTLACKWTHQQMTCFVVQIAQFVLEPSSCITILACVGWSVCLQCPRLRKAIQKTNFRVMRNHAIIQKLSSCKLQLDGV